jgi:hypothetical protein
LIFRVNLNNLDAENKAIIVEYLNLFQEFSNIMSSLKIDSNENNYDNILTKFKLDSLLNKIKEIRELVHSQTCYDNTENKFSSEEMLIHLNEINENLLFLKLSKLQPNY